MRGTVLDAGDTPVDRVITKFAIYQVVTSGTRKISRGERTRGGRPLLVQGVSDSGCDGGVEQDGGARRRRRASGRGEKTCKGPGPTQGQQGLVAGLCVGLMAIGQAGCGVGGNDR